MPGSELRTDILSLNVEAVLLVLALDPSTGVCLRIAASGDRLISGHSEPYGAMRLGLQPRELSSNLPEDILNKIPTASIQLGA